MPLPFKRNKSKRSVGGAFMFVGGMVLFCGLGGFFLLAKMFKEDSAKLPSTLDLAQSKGLPLTDTDLRELTPVVPANQNAAPTYREAIKVFTKTFGSKVAITPYRPLSSNWYKEMKKRNAAFRPTLKVVEQAAKFPECDFGIDYGKWDGTYQSNKLAFPEGKAMRDVVNYLGNTVAEDRRSGNTEVALHDIEILFAVARHSPRFAPIYGGAWGHNAYSRGLASLIRILAQHWQEPKVVARVQQLAASVVLPNLYESLQTDFVLGFDSIHRIKSLEQLGLDQNTPKAFSKAIDEMYKSPVVRQGFEAKFAKIYIEYFAALPKNPQDWQGIRSGLEKVKKDLDDDHSIDNAIARQITPVYLGLPLGFATTQAVQRMLVTATKLIQANPSARHFPTLLPDYGEASIDPMNGKPLRYRSEKDGFTLYSVGTNLKDNGGKRPMGQGRNRGEDIVLRISNQPVSN